MLDADVIREIFTGEGASILTWERGERCVCFSDDSKQPRWSANPPPGCTCGGYGAIYAPAILVTGLFRSQTRFKSARAQGELDHGEASLTTPKMPVTREGVTYPECKPGYTDVRVRDRFTVVAAGDDSIEGRIFYPAAKAVPFLVGNTQMAWRVQLQALAQEDRLAPQPPVIVAAPTLPWQVVWDDNLATDQPYFPDPYSRDANGRAIVPADGAAWKKVPVEFGDQWRATVKVTQARAATTDGFYFGFYNADDGGSNTDGTVYIDMGINLFTPPEIPQGEAFLEAFEYPEHWSQPLRRMAAPDRLPTTFWLRAARVNGSLTLEAFGEDPDTGASPISAIRAPHEPIATPLPGLFLDFYAAGVDAILDRITVEIPT